MSDQGKANYEAYRKLAGRPGVSAQPLPDYEQLPMELRYAFDAGADAVERWLAEAPADEDAPGSEPSTEEPWGPANVVTIEEHRWYAAVRSGGPDGDVVKVIGYRGDSGISYHDSVADWEAASQ